MRSIRFFLFAFILILSACRSDSAAEAETSGDGITPTPIDKPTQAAAPTEAQISEQTQRIVQAFTTGYWYVEGWVQMNSPEASLQNRGRWFKFSPDGTYTSGRYQKTTGKGTWKYTPSLATVQLEAENFNETGEFTIKMATNNQVMIWVGTERYKQTGIQCKLENYVALMEELPTPSN
jgi:hypothetical protein